MHSGSFFHALFRPRQNYILFHGWAAISVSLRILFHFRFVSSTKNRNLVKKKVKTKCAKRNSLANFVRFVRLLLYAALERRRIASNKMTSIYFLKITFSVVAFSVLCLITIKVKQKTKYQNKSELMLIY